MWTKIRSAKSIFINFKWYINPIVSLQKVVVFFWRFYGGIFIDIFLSTVFKGHVGKLEKSNSGLFSEEWVTHYVYSLQCGLETWLLVFSQSLEIFSDFKTVRFPDYHFLNRSINCVFTFEDKFESYKKNDAFPTCLLQMVLRVKRKKLTQNSPLSSTEYSFKPGLIWRSRWDCCVFIVT